MARKTRVDRPECTLFRNDFPAEEFAARRSNIFQAIGEDGCAVVQGGATPCSQSGAFRQEPGFHYCSGIEAPGAYLVMTGADRSTTLYLRHRPEEMEDPVGGPYTVEDADEIKKATGVDDVRGIEDMEGHIKGCKIVYAEHRTPSAPIRVEDPWDGQTSRGQQFLDLLKSRLPDAEIRDLTLILDKLRGVKSERELDMLRDAGRLSAQGVIECMRITRPGLYEYQFGAVANYLYMDAGGAGEGYNSIISSGKDNIWYGHYSVNSSKLVDGDLVLMDSAPYLGSYTSDIGRMWPVNGKYDDLQRTLYGFIVEYHKTLLELVGPGAEYEAILTEAAARMSKVLAKTKFSEPSYEEAARQTLGFKHHLSHPVGMEVHDVDNYREAPMKPGLVLSLDPSLWVRDRKTYIRVEDTVAVTENGIENFTVDAPLELDDVEATMREDSEIFQAAQYGK